MRRIFGLFAAALGGSLVVAVAPHAGAAPVSAAPLRAVGVVAPAASGSPPKVVAVLTASLPQVTVVAGDTLSGIAARTARQWPQLWKWPGNHIANPDLIYVGQVVQIPPASFSPGSYTYPASAPRYTPPAPQRSYSTSSTRTYTASRSSSGSGYSHSYSGGSGGGAFTGVWACIAQHESGGNAATNTGNGYYGGLQFTLGTWQANGGSGNPANASAAEQQRVAQNVVNASGGSYGAWPNTSRMCGV